LANLLLPFRPRLLSASRASFDRPTAALLESLNPRYDLLIRLESVALLLLHGGLVFTGLVPWTIWLTLVGAFGVSWSSMQYMHHYHTERDVHKGARNLRTFRWLDTLWLNHNWHQRHHEHPHIPWTQLPHLGEGPSAPRESMLQAWLRQWRGPTFAPRSHPNPHAGKSIR
jgi:fatty acid desaturase